MRLYRGEQVNWCFTPSQPVRLYRGEQVNWCFTPSQPVRLYRGEQVNWCFTPSQPVRLYRGEQVNWCFTPSQPVRLYRGEQVNWCFTPSQPVRLYRGEQVNWCFTPSQPVRLYRGEQVNWCFTPSQPVYRGGGGENNGEKGRKKTNPKKREKAGNRSHGRMPTREQREEKTRPTVVCTGQQREIMDKTQTVRNQRCLFGANYGMKQRPKLPPELRPPLLNLSIDKPSSTQSLFGSENSFPCLKM